MFLSVSGFRPRSATDLSVFRGRSNLFVLAVEAFLDVEYSSRWRVARPFLAPTRAPLCALPCRVAEPLMEVTKSEVRHLAGGTSSTLTSAASAPRDEEVKALETADTVAADDDCPEAVEAAVHALSAALTMA